MGLKERFAEEMRYLRELGREFAEDNPQLAQFLGDKANDPDVERLLEANEPGWGASGRNGGQVNPTLKYDPDQLVQMYGAERAFATGVPSYIYAFHRYTGNSTTLYHTLVSQF